jgi:hypothetical protein
MTSPPPARPRTGVASLSPQVLRAASLIDREELLIDHLRLVSNTLLRREIELELCGIRSELRLLGFAGRS